MVHAALSHATNDYPIPLRHFEALSHSRTLPTT
jgi:hypothetical protein